MKLLCCVIRAPECSRSTQASCLYGTWPKICRRAADVGRVGCTDVPNLTASCHASMLESLCMCFGAQRVQCDSGISSQRPIQMWLFGPVSISRQQLQIVSSKLSLAVQVLHSSTDSQTKSGCVEQHGGLTIRRMWYLVVLAVHWVTGPVHVRSMSKGAANVEQ